MFPVPQVALNRSSFQEHETYETIPEVFGCEDDPPPLRPHRESGQHAKMMAASSLSLNTSNNVTQSSTSGRHSESDSVFTNSLEAHSGPPVVGRSPIPQRKQLRHTCSHSDALTINERPPCPVPKSSQMSHAYSTTGIGNNEVSWTHIPHS